jgi:hypothetical protein
MKIPKANLILGGILCVLTFISLILPKAAGAASASEPKLQNFPDARKLEDQDSEDQFRFGLGYSTFGTFSKTKNLGSFSAILDFNTTHSIQVFFGISDVRESFNFGAGSLYRATISGDRMLGFHVGALVQLGSDESDFAAQMGPVFGIHVAAFQLQQLQLSLEGGPIFHYREKPDLSFTPLSAGLGFNIHYFF